MSSQKKVREKYKPNDYKKLFAEKDGPAVFGMSKLNNNKDMQKSAKWLAANGIKSVITIEHEDCIETYSAVYKAKMDWYTCFLLDWHAPCVTQLHEYCRMVKALLKDGGVATHCDGGTGRTGVFLAAYLLFSGRAKNAQEAFTSIRNDYDEDAVETKAQYNALARYAEYIDNEKPKYKDPRDLTERNKYSLDYEGPEESKVSFFEWKDKTEFVSGKKQINRSIHEIAINKDGEQYMDERKEYIGGYWNKYLLTVFRKKFAKAIQEKKDEDEEKKQANEDSCAAAWNDSSNKNGKIIQSDEDEEKKYVDEDDESVEPYHTPAELPQSQTYVYDYDSDASNNSLASDHGIAQVKSINLGSRKARYSLRYSHNQLRSGSDENVEIWC
mmetsp:Transcript_11370/g.12709  ORF Transcript_11370/g.12709 Transcript_11370/m.12709 type:complete len:384 (+) Transcript_11370:144-1295(+)